jgi:hypothetical protein
MKKIEGLHFQPWIGKEYELKGKLLLLGESHYMDEEPNEEDDFSKGYDNFTTEVIGENYLAGKEMRTPFFRKIGLMFNPSDEYKIWNEISFANAIQVGLWKAKSQPSPKDIATITPAFNLLLNHLRPKKVLVLSRRMWNYWIPEDNGTQVSRIEENGKWSTVWNFNYNGGSCLGMGTIHPSRMLGNSCHKWKPLIDKFLSMN